MQKNTKIGDLYLFLVNTEDYKIYFYNKDSKSIV